MSEPAVPAPTWVPTFPRIRRLDDAWARGERVAIALMFLVMGLVVFASVITEVFGRRQQWSDVGVLFVVAVTAIRTRTVRPGERAPGWPVSLAVAAALTAVLAAGVHVYTTEFPGGFIWAQKLAMVLFIWVAMVGASLATWDRSHLSLEMGEKLWPAAALRFVKAFAHAVTTVGALVAFWWGLELVRREHATGAVVSSAAEWIPSWVAYLVLPYGFAMMAMRFLAQAATTATGTAAPADERLPS